MSEMPARIWVDAHSWTASVDHHEGDAPFVRADIAERMAEAASDTLAKFDACSDSAVRNTPLGLTKLRSALNSYREVNNVESR
jgi:hypothetical protein